MAPNWTKFAAHGLDLYSRGSLAGRPFAANSGTAIRELPTNSSCLEYFGANAIDG